MAENNDHGSVDVLSQRVSKALEEDAQRRRWVARTFVILAVVPAIAAVMVFLYGRSDVEQTQQLVQEKASQIEAKVSEKVTASVANELQSARQVQELLPEIKQVVKVAPLVQENKRALSEYSSRVDSVAERTEKAESQAEIALTRIGETAKHLETRVNRAEDKIANVERVRESIDKVLVQQNSLARAIQETEKNLDARVNNAERKIARVDRVSKSIDGIRSEVLDTRRVMSKQMDERFNALYAPGSDLRRIGGLESQLKSLSGKYDRLKSQQSTAAVPVSTSRLEKKVNSLVRQMTAINKRVSALERRRESAGTANLSKQINSMNRKLDSLIKSVSGMNKRLTKLEKGRPTRVRPPAVFITPR